MSNPNNNHPDTEKILKKLDYLITHLDTRLLANPDFIFFDNQQFCILLNISKKLANEWRNNKVIAYSKIGMKYYYRLSDIYIMLQSNYYPNF
jgi:hypothetical protein